MTTPLTNEQYEPIRRALFNCTPGQSYEKAKLRIAEELEADGWEITPLGEVEKWKRRAEQAKERLHAVVNEHADYIKGLREESSAVHRPH